MDFTAFEPYEVAPDRAIRIISEMLVHLLQRKAHCTNGCKCIVAKSIQLVRNWPGSQLTWKEELLLSYMLGRISAAPLFLKVFEDVMQFDFGMGAEYCIQKAEKMAHLVYKDLLTEHQSKWN